MTVSIHSACCISMKPWVSPWADRISPMAEIPPVMSQNPQLPSLKLQSSLPVTLGQT